MFFGENSWHHYNQRRQAYHESLLLVELFQVFPFFGKRHDQSYDSKQDAAHIEDPDIFVSISANSLDKSSLLIGLIQLKCKFGYAERLRLFSNL